MSFEIPHAYGEGEFFAVRGMKDTDKGSYFDVVDSRNNIDGKKGESPYDVWFNTSEDFLHPLGESNVILRAYQKNPNKLDLAKEEDIPYANELSKNNLKGYKPYPLSINPITMEVNSTLAHIQALRAWVEMNSGQIDSTRIILKSKQLDAFNKYIEELKYNYRMLNE
jgi:hypothetical protein